MAPDTSFAVCGETSRRTAAWPRQNECNPMTELGIQLATAWVLGGCLSHPAAKPWQLPGRYIAPAPTLPTGAPRSWIFHSELTAVGKLVHVAFPMRRWHLVRHAVAVGLDACHRLPLSLKHELITVAEVDGTILRRHQLNVCGGAIRTERDDQLAQFATGARRQVDLQRVDDAVGRGGLRPPVSIRGFFHG